MKKELAEAKLALEASQKLLDVCRTNLKRPEILESRLAELLAQRDSVQKKIDQVMQDQEAAGARYEASIELVKHRQQDLKKVQHRVKLERLEKLRKQLEAMEPEVQDVQQH